MAKPSKLRAALDPTETHGHGSMLDRFIAKVEFRQDGHWIWRGSLSKSGNRSEGRFSAGSAGVIWAHEASFRMLRGEIPAGTALLRCEVRLCVNPDHIIPFLGDGGRRSVGKIARAGELRRSYWSKKKREVVLQDLGDEFGVTREAIRLVLAGKIKGQRGKLAGKVDEIRARYTGMVSAAEIGAALGFSKHAASGVVSCRTYRL